MENTLLDIKKVKKEYEEVLSSLSTKYNKIEYVASVSTLDLNKDIIGFFYSTINRNYKKEEACIRLYGLLQALFVSIDSIYSLSLALTNSKNFIRINDNPTLRELKYIRNDVVGHPTNRIIQREVVYCVLNPKDITKYSFKYHVFNLDEETIREISFVQMIYDYYFEATKVLSILLNYQEVHKNKLFNDDILFMINSYKNNQNINNLFRQFRTEYKKVYTESSRVYKRIMLLTKVNKLPHTKLNNFSYLYHLVRLYEMVSNVEKCEPIKISVEPLPDEVYEIKKFFINHYEYRPLINTLVYYNNPGFKEALNHMINLMKKYNLSNGRLFFEEIRKRISKEMYDEAYALESILKMFI